MTAATFRDAPPDPPPSPVALRSLHRHWHPPSTGAETAAAPWLASNNRRAGHAGGTSCPRPWHPDATRHAPSNGAPWCRCPLGAARHAAPPPCAPSAAKLRGFGVQGAGFPWTQHRPLTFLRLDAPRPRRTQAGLTPPGASAPSLARGLLRRLDPRRRVRKWGCMFLDGVAGAPQPWGCS